MSLLSKWFGNKSDDKPTEVIDTTDESWEEDYNKAYALEYRLFISQTGRHPCYSYEYSGIAARAESRVARNHGQ